ncbi:DUF317 domain-containing protein [Streptomyces roseicoloratus]|uniref:DUF317 domain-containing protein n=1 Tax=Streptomyces roseicoloratus TaxID=2508722 RepID=A0ABY9RZS3_9ACTN|nr:DUF317 domain-containing protein [Streptomyces roseicoloratus]WMX47041.1 DUF317 domain-containing protein [Streptomyces roseicoloratus]
MWQEPGSLSSVVNRLRGRHRPCDSATPFEIRPNGLCGAERTRVACSFELGDLPVAWQISAQSHPGGTLPEWNAYFTVGVPHEALTDLLLALDARTVPAFSFDGPEIVLAAVCAQGWVRDIDRPHIAALAPGLSAGISLEEVPRSFAMPIRGLVASIGRRGRNLLPAPRISGARLQRQHAARSGRDLRSLARLPNPLPRSCLPVGVEGQLDVIQPGARWWRRARGSE